MDKQRIDENIALITEMLSISDEVAQIAETLYSDVQRCHDGCNFRKVRDCIYMATVNKQYTLWGENINVKFIIYEVSDRNVFKKEINRIPTHNSFLPSTKTLTLTMIFLYGSLYRNFGGASDSIYHEVEHVYEWIMGKRNNPKFKGLVNQAYDYAIDKIRNSKDEVQLAIAWVIYYSNPHEQDAFVHQLYKQCKNSQFKNDTKTTEVDGHYKNFKKRLEWLEKNINNQYVQTCMNPYRKYGYSPKNILYYGKKGLERFYNKMERVRWRILSLEECLTYEPPISEEVAEYFADTIDIDKIVNRLIRKLKKRS